MDDLISEFIEETTESLSMLDLDLVKLEQQPDDKELLGNIFRVMHTIKGTCGFIGLSRLERTAHAAENLLDNFRSGRMEVTEMAMTLLFMCIDRVRYLVTEVHNKGAEPAGDDTDIVSAIESHIDSVMNGGTAAQAPAAPTPAPQNQPENTGQAAPDILPDTLPDMMEEAKPVPQTAPAAPLAPMQETGPDSKSERPGISPRADEYARRSHQYGVGACPDTQPAPPAYQAGERYGDDCPVPAPEQDRFRFAGQRDENAYAAYRQRLVKIAAHRPRSFGRTQKENYARNVGRGNRA